jgi:hypothetical protein
MVWEFPAVSHTRYDFWKAKQYTQSGMWWFTLVFGALGLHHYMLRSPQTGMIFFLTNMLLFGYPWFYDLVQLSSYGETFEDLNTYGLGHPWGALGLAQGMWRKPDDPETTENDDAVIAAAAAASAAASVAKVLQSGGGDAPEKPKACPKDEYEAPTPWFFILYNLFVPLSPLAHIIGGNRERAVTRFLYLFAGIIFAVIFTIVFGILWFFLPASASDLIYSIYPSALALVSLAYLFAVIYDYIIMMVVPSDLFFNSKECNLNGFVGFKEDPPCPSVGPLSAVTNVLKPATDIAVLVYTYISGTIKSIGSGIYSMTPMGRAEMMAKAAAGAAGGLPGAAGLGALSGARGLPGAGLGALAAGGLSGAGGLPGAGLGALAGGIPNPAAIAAKAKTDIAQAASALPSPQKGGARTELEPLDYLGGGVIGAVLLGGFILGSFRNVSRREYWLNDSPPNPRGV